MKVWPVRLFPARVGAPRLVGGALRGGTALSGVARSVRSDGGGLWLLEYGGIFVRTPDQVRAWRAWEAFLDGGATNCVVPFIDYRHAPRPLISGVPALPPPAVPHSDDTYLSDDTGYGGSVISAVLTADAALRATTLGIQMLVGSDLRGGEHFTLDHADIGPRLYRVISIESADASVHQVTIRPPLREAVTAGTVADFDTPRFVASLADADGMDLELQNNRFATGASVRFLEAF